MDTSRPASQHQQRPSTSSSGVDRATPMRPHAHTVSLGALNANHRVNRRKSSTSMTGANRAALVAAIREGSQSGLHENRPLSQQGLGISTGPGQALATPGQDLGRSMSSASRKTTSALTDGPPLASSKSLSKARSRRASDGSILKKERRNTNTGELKCEKCGKSYKHGSCLQKHLWEHTPEWSLTSKLLISKHAQVQMLEAASVLVAMTGESQADLSDTSSQSPLASGSSEPIEDDENSSRTSTPSQEDEYQGAEPKSYRNPRRQDSYSSVFSRSYGSTAASSLPTDNGFHHRWGSGSRPGTSQSYAEEQADINAAAEGLVGVSIGTPQFRASHFSSDVPPVPPLPAKFAHQAMSPDLRPAYSPIEILDNEHRYQIRPEEEEGMFGRMEQ